MKKLILAAVLISSLILSACGGGNKENVQTESAAAAEQNDGKGPGQAAGGPANDAIAESRPAGAAPQVTVALPEEYEPEIFEGVVTGYTVNILTVENDDESMYFDISAADIGDDESPLVRGCYVEVSYADAPEQDVYPSDMVIVIMDNEQLAAEEDRDPVIYGRLRFIDENDLIMIDDAGNEVTLDNNISRTVSFENIEVNDEIIVTYCGTLEKSDDDDDGTGYFDGIAYALKIVTPDALNTEEAQSNYLDCVVDRIVGENMQVSNELTEFNCAGDPELFAKFKEEDSVRVYYTGSLTDIILNVTDVQPL